MMMMTVIIIIIIVMTIKSSATMTRRTIKATLLRRRGLLPRLPLPFRIVCPTMKWLRDTDSRNCINEQTVPSILWNLSTTATDYRYILTSIVDNGLRIFRWIYMHRKGEIRRFNVNVVIVGQPSIEQYPGGFGISCCGIESFLKNGDYDPPIPRR